MAVVDNVKLSQWLEEQKVKFLKVERVSIAEPENTNTFVSSVFFLEYLQISNFSSTNTNCNFFDDRWKYTIEPTEQPSDKWGSVATEEGIKLAKGCICIYYEDLFSKNYERLTNEYLLKRLKIAGLDIADFVDWLLLPETNLQSFSIVKGQSLIENEIEDWTYITTKPGDKNEDWQEITDRFMASAFAMQKIQEINNEVQSA